MKLTSFLLCVVLLIVSESSQGVVITIPALDAGRYSSSGFHDPNDQNYLSGNVGGTDYAGFLAFDVSSVSGTRSAVIEQTTISQQEQLARRVDLDKPFDPLSPVTEAPYAYMTTVSEVMKTTRSFTLTNFFDAFDADIIFGEQTLTAGSDYLFIQEVLTDPQAVLAGGSGQTSIYDDLRSGVEFDSFFWVTVPPTLIDLDQTTLLEESIWFGDSTTLVLGLDFVDRGDTGEYVFGGSGGDISKVMLRLNGSSIASRTFETVLSTQATILSETVSFEFNPNLAIVPEPNSPVLILFAGCLLFFRRQAATS